MEPVVIPALGDASPSAANGEAALGEACAARGDWAGGAHHFRGAFAAAPGLSAATRFAVAPCRAGNDFGVLTVLSSLADAEARVRLWHEVLREPITRQG